MSIKDEMHRLAASLFKRWQDWTDTCVRNQNLVSHGLIPTQRGTFGMLMNARPLDVLFEQLEGKGFCNGDNIPPERSHMAPIQFKIDASAIQSLSTSEAIMILDKNGWMFERTDGKLKICVIVEAQSEKLSDLQHAKIFALEFSDWNPEFTAVTAAAEAPLQQFMYSHFKPEFINDASYFVDLLGPYGTRTPGPNLPQIPSRSRFAIIKSRLGL